ncbi:MAG TPA: hypothetical protein VNO43_02380 [Candidatus Eisenbacteria bacterium]|nr:hypothetical protein [Candidatus Eisenbacteria bacterium]
MSGIGSLAHYAALTIMKRLDNERVAYITTNTTAGSHAVLTSKAADAVILTPPYTSMAILSGYVDLGNTFDVRDLQGGLAVRTSRIQNNRAQVKAMLHAPRPPDLRGSPSDQAFAETVASRQFSKEHTKETKEESQRAGRAYP